MPSAIRGGRQSNRDGANLHLLADGHTAEDDYGGLVRAPLPSVTGRLLIGLDVLVTALLVVAALRPAGSMARWTSVLVAVLFAAAYVAGRVKTRVHDEPIDAPRGAWWPSGMWMAALIVAWLALLVVSDGALWLAFPLMLWQMHVLGPRRGVIAVAVTTVVAAGHSLLDRAPGGFALAEVLGPVVGAAVAVAVVVGYEALMRESHERQRTVEELRRVRADAAIAVHEAAVASERERLAREIHDTLAQGFSAIELLLRAATGSLGAENATARELIEQARRTAQDNLGEARQFVKDLAPADLVGTSLVAALTRVTERAQALAASEPRQDEFDGAAPTLTIHLHISGAARALPLPIEAALVRIAQSSLANVVTHARATRATLTLTFLPSEVILDVVDNGRGFSAVGVGVDGIGPERPDESASDEGGFEKGGFGLVAMRSRVHDLGGSFTMETGPGEGTAVAVRLPVTQEGHRD